MILKKLYPDMCVEQLNFVLDKTGNLVKEEDNIFKGLGKEDRLGHAKDIDFIHRSKAYHRELDKLTRDIQKGKILTRGDGELYLQLLLFIAGIKARFKAISTEYEVSNKPKQEHMRTHPLGSMAK